MSLVEAENLDHKAWQDLAENLNVDTALFIDGNFVNPKKGNKFENLNPATGKPLNEMARASNEDVDAAVANAKAVFKGGAWSRMAPRDRMEVLYKFGQLIEENAIQFALIDTLDMGKSISEMLTIDVPFSAHTFQYYAETIDKIEGTVTNTEYNALHYITREPLGVVGCIVPWNYPLMMAAWKIAPALAAGNSVILKPAEQSPMSGLLLGKLFMEAGGPAGVLNVINGFGEDVGKALALHMDVAKIAFTGSTEVGKLMMVYSGQSNMKRVTTECGGKTPQIIMADTESLDNAVEYAVNGIYGNQGEVCNAGSRLLVQSSIYDEFVSKFIVKTKSSYSPGDPLDPATTMGPMVTREQQDRVIGYIDVGKAEGAKLEFGGGIPAGQPQGYFVEPTMFTGVNNDMKIAREEIFGPVVCVLPFDDLDDAISIANDTIYGLAASIWTSNLKTAHRMVKEIEAGIVWVNCFDHGDMTQPWGGYKQSGQGRDKCFETVLAHTQTKSVWFNLG